MGLRLFQMSPELFFTEILHTSYILIFIIKHTYKQHKKLMNAELLHFRLIIQFILLEISNLFLLICMFHGENHLPRGATENSTLLFTVPILTPVCPYMLLSEIK